MLQLLVDGRNTLDLGEIVPVGDLFDTLAEGDEPFTESARHHFENARNLYRRKLLPLIESRHGISKAEADARPKDDRTARAFRTDDRLAKTLLLSALAPDVDTLKNLTAARLAALNHGSIRTPIEGREGQEVLRRCRAWAAEIGEVRIGDDPANPTIAVQLSAVDTESILADAGRHDNTGDRRRLIREILFAELGIAVGALPVARSRLRTATAGAGAPAGRTGGPVRTDLRQSVPGAPGFRRADQDRGAAPRARAGVACGAGAGGTRRHRQAAPSVDDADRRTPAARRDG